LAGEPGVGKTVFSMQFLVKGVELNEPGVYISFAEARDTLIENFSRHLNVDLARLEAEGKIKILDFTAIKEEALPIVLESILKEVEALKAERLVIDSFSALAQAFKEPIDVRIIVHTILSRIVREMNCTTIMIEEVPIGESKIGLGMEEFVADGVLRLRAGELEGRLFRDLEIVKLRGTRLSERKLAFTLEGGFKAFPPFKLKPVEKPSRFKPIPDKPDKYSTGVKDLDGMLEGGLLKGSIVLLELDEKASTIMYHLLVAPMAANFVLQGRGVLVVPSSGVDPALFHKYINVYGGTEEEWRRYARFIVARSPLKTETEPNIIMVGGEDWKADLSKVVEAANKLSAETGKPNLSIVGVDTLITLYGKGNCEKILNLTATMARRVEAPIIAIVKAGYRDLAVKLSPIADIYLRLTREHGCLLFYGVKPRTGLYAVEMDVSGGYPLPKLTPIV
jgi:KaiC/GvpD/RAD55 family RecA-like ATPase